MKRTVQAAISFAAVALLVLVSGAALNWPAASAAQNGLARLYGRGRARMVDLKVNSFDWACGTYMLPGKPERWKFVETRRGLWAEERRESWMHQAARGQGEQEWSNCMLHQRRGRNSGRLYAYEDWMARTLAGVVD